MFIEETMTIGQVLAKLPLSRRIFLEFGMNCLGCSHGKHETLTQAAAAHDVNLDELLHQLNECLAEQEE